MFMGKCDFTEWSIFVGPTALGYAGINVWEKKTGATAPKE
jgi:hypothetical protein